jgi:hypothetical protein
MSCIKDKKIIEFPYDKFETILAIEGGFKGYMLDAIREVEQCDIDMNGNLISKFTNTPLSISKMSDGCKTIIYIAYTIEKNINTKDMVNITVCGANAIKYILEKFENSDLYLFLDHWEISKNINVKFNFNDVEYSSTTDLMSI